MNDAQETTLIRPISPQDACAVVALMHVAFAAQSVVTDPPSAALKESVATVSAHLQQGGGAVAEADGSLVGAVLWAEREGGLYIGRLSVHPAWRRRGIARSLVAAAEAAARVMQLPRLHLGARLVLLDNRRLFASCGFVETVQTAHPGYAEPTSVTMEKWLT